MVKAMVNAYDRKQDVDDERTKRQREHIARVLTESNGKVSGIDGAAARMGISRTTLISRMKKLCIEPKDYSCFEQC